MLLSHGKLGNTHEMSVGVSAMPTTAINRLSGMQILVCGGVDMAAIRLLNRCRHLEVLPGSPLAAVKVLAGLEPQCKTHTSETKIG
jgi:hypothetical protein